MVFKRLNIKRVAASLLVFLLIIPSIPASALSEEEITAPSAILIEAETGKVLYEKNSHEQRACASITKVMTLLLVMEAIDSGIISLDDNVTASAHAASMGGSDIWLEEGETMTVDDMIKATAVASANDAAVALAELISGTEDDFVTKMNEKAASLGMAETVFKNCNGLDEEGHITSAYDVALMSAELIKHEKIYDYTSIWLDYLRDGATQIVNTNKLLKSYNGITGLKTGTTSDAGSCISATAQRNGLSIIAVVLGADSGTNRFKDAATLLDYGFANYEVSPLGIDDSTFSAIKVTKGMKDSVDVKCDVQGSIVVQKGAASKVEHGITVQEELEAPVVEGQKVGTLTYSLDGENIAQYDIVTLQAVEEISFSSVFSVMLNALIKL